MSHDFVMQNYRGADAARITFHEGMQEVQHVLAHHMLIMHTIAGILGNNNSKLLSELMLDNVCQNCQRSS